MMPLSSSPPAERNRRLHSNSGTSDVDNEDSILNSHRSLHSLPEERSLRAMAGALQYGDNSMIEGIQDYPNLHSFGLTGTALDYYQQAVALDLWPRRKGRADEWEDGETARQGMAAAFTFHAVRRARFIYYRKWDALGPMKTGCSFLCFSQRGPPVFRLLQLSADSSEVVCIGKDKSVITVDLRQCSVVFGQTTQAFQKAPRQLALCSFSLVTETVTLDIVAKDALEYAVWTEALSVIVEDWASDRTTTINSELFVKLPLLPMQFPSSYLCLIKSCMGSLRKLGFFQQEAIQTSIPGPLTPGETIFFSRGTQKQRKFIDCLQYLVEGSAFLCYLSGSSGPKMRKLVLELKDGKPERQARIAVYSLPKSSKDKSNKPKLRASVGIRSIERIQLGQTTERFNKHAAPRELAYLSMSIIVQDENHKLDSIDLVAQTADAFELWHVALLRLAERPNDFLALPSDLSPNSGRSDSPPRKPRDKGPKSPKAAAAAVEKEPALVLPRVVVEVLEPTDERGDAIHRIPRLFRNIEPTIQERYFGEESDREGYLRSPITTSELFDRDLPHGQSGVKRFVPYYSPSVLLPALPHTLLPAPVSQGTMSSVEYSPKPPRSPIHREHDGSGTNSPSSTFLSRLQPLQKLMGRSASSTSVTNTTSTVASPNSARMSGSSTGWEVSNLPVLGGENEGRQSVDARPSSASAASDWLQHNSASPRNGGGGILEDRFSEPHSATILPRGDSFTQVSLPSASPPTEGHALSSLPTVLGSSGVGNSVRPARSLTGGKAASPKQSSPSKLNVLRALLSNDKEAKGTSSRATVMTTKSVDLDDDLLNSLEDKDLQQCSDPRRSGGSGSGSVSGLSGGVSGVSGSVSGGVWEPGTLQRKRTESPVASPQGRLATLLTGTPRSMRNASQPERERPVFYSAISLPAEGRVLVRQEDEDNSNEDSVHSRSASSRDRTAQNRDKFVRYWL